MGGIVAIRQERIGGPSLERSVLQLETIVWSEMISVKNKTMVLVRGKRSFPRRMVAEVDSSRKDDFHLSWYFCCVVGLPRLSACVAKLLGSGLTNTDAEVDV